MKVAQVLHMNGGVGHASYANNSLVQQKVICLTKPIREEAITSLYCNRPQKLGGCRFGLLSGPNTLLVVSEFIKIVEKLCRELNHKSPEYKVFLNDLPGNDFNNIFKSLDSFKEKLCDEMERNHKEEKLDTFNIPLYTPSPSEVKLEVLKEGSFAINRLEVSEVNWNAFDDRNALEFESERSDTLSDGGYNVAQCMRAVAEPMLVSHFAEAIIEEVFSRYQQILTDRMSKEQTKFINVTVLLTRKA
ncbi:hypothetical protein JHK87_045182 [Glycine soja]|nr:hypothetical protein JHK87_045182 [Glycine soja]